MPAYGGKSILEMTEADIEEAGWNTRLSLARNGIPNGRTCKANEHRLDLDEEDGVLYLTCTKCRWTKFLKPQAKEDVRTDKHYPGEIRFRSI